MKIIIFLLLFTSCAQVKHIKSDSSIVKINEIPIDSVVVRQKLNKIEMFLPFVWGMSFGIIIWEAIRSDF